MKTISLKPLKWLISGLIICVFLAITYKFFDFTLIISHIEKLKDYPFLTVFILLLYFFSFCLKALAWKLYLKNNVKFSSCLMGLFYSLFINHILPLKVGDFFRAAIMSHREKHISIALALHSVITLRVLDMISLLSISLIGLGLFHFEFRIPGWLFMLLFIVMTLTVVAFYTKARSFLLKQLLLFKENLLSIRGIFIVIVVFISGLLEAALVFGTLWMVGQPVSVLEAIWVNSMTVSGQVFQITPGGIANYEAIMSVTLNLLNIGFKEGYSVALITHGLKFFFSYTVGVMTVLAFPLSYKMLQSLIKRRGMVE